MTASSLAVLLSWGRARLLSAGAVILPEESLTTGNSQELPGVSSDDPGPQAASLSSWGGALAPWIMPDGAEGGNGAVLSGLLIAGVAGNVGGAGAEVLQELLIVGRDGVPRPQEGSGFSGLRDVLARGLGLSGEPPCSCALCQGMAVGARRELITRFGGRPSGQDPEQAVAALRPAPDQPQPSGTGGPAAAPVAAATPVALALTIADQDVFNLETNPGASKTVYLNFRGANLSGTQWIPSGSSWNGVAPAFTLDSDTSTNFSAAELAAIKEIFARVACDYAPFNVNVTTKAPTSDRINRSSSSDSVYGTVCLFSNISSQTGYANAGGVAYVGVFNSVNAEAYKPALVFPNKLGNNAKSIAEAASHEIGHNLNLSHDGTTGGSAYYSGQGSNPGWAPIMGVGYYKTLTQFSRGSYSGANNTENDFSQIAGEGVGYWQDVIGNDRATASSLTLTDADGDGLSDKLQVGGTIEITASNGLGTPDRDFYSFLAPSDGSVTINVRNALYYFDPAAAQYTFAPVPGGFGNLRLDARLENASGIVLADWSTNASLDVTNFSVSGLSGGQDYYLSVFANASSPDGEDTYGSLGDYVLDLVYQGQPGPPVLPPTYTLSTPASVSEGQALTIGITTTQVADGTSLNWRLSGSGISAEDVAPAALTGSVTVTSGAASLPLTVAADNLLEPTESALFELLNGSTVVASRSISLLDTNSRWGTTGNDTITGTANRFERISGVLSSGTTAASLGSGQVDVVTGGAGPDEFSLSEVRSGALRVFYNDNTNNRTGTADYLRVADFNRSEDKLRLGGGRYFSRNNGSDTWIWYDRNNNGALNTTNNQSSSDELIAVLSGVNLGSATLTSTSTPSWAVFG